MLENADIENVWKKFKDGQLSLSKAQKEIDKLFLVQKGFFKRLEDNLTRIVTERISNQTSGYLNASAYLCKLRQLERELIQNSNWVNFWLACPWLKAPTSEDIETIHSLSDGRLRDYYMLIRESLRQLANNGLENSMEASILNSFYLLMKQEMKLRTGKRQVVSRRR
jgi:hypothetical protein